jgi:hypothetical protein
MAELSLILFWTIIFAQRISDLRSYMARSGTDVMIF